MLPLMSQRRFFSYDATLLLLYAADTTLLLPPLFTPSVDVTGATLDDDIFTPPLLAILFAPCCRAYAGLSPRMPLFRCQRPRR